MSWIFIADDGEEVHYAVPPRVAELEQELSLLEGRSVLDTLKYVDSLEQRLLKATAKLAELRAHSKLLREAAQEFFNKETGGAAEAYAAKDRLKALLKQGGE